MYKTILIQKEHYVNHDVKKQLIIIKKGFFRNSIFVYFCLRIEYFESYNNF